MSSTGSASRKSRNDSPAPKAKPAAAKPVAAPQAKKEEDVEEESICGFHPQAFRVLILGPLAVGGVIASTVFLDVGKVAVAFVQKHWAPASVTAGKWLIKNSEFIVLMITLLSFAPLILAGLVTLFRATQDLGHFPLWQQASLGVLVTVAIGTAVTVEGGSAMMNNVRGYWDKVSDPVEELLAKKADNIIAGAAIACMAPIAAAMAMAVLRGVWSCRVKIVVEKDAAPGRAHSSGSKDEEEEGFFGDFDILNIYPVIAAGSLIYLASQNGWNFGKTMSNGGDEAVFFWCVKFLLAHSAFAHFFMQESVCKREGLDMDEGQAMFQGEFASLNGAMALFAILAGHGPAVATIAKCNATLCMYAALRHVEYRKPAAVWIPGMITAALLFTAAFHSEPLNLTFNLF